MTQERDDRVIDYALRRRGAAPVRRHRLAVASAVALAVSVALMRLGGVDWEYRGICIAFVFIGCLVGSWLVGPLPHGPLVICLLVNVASGAFLVVGCVVRQQVAGVPVTAIDYFRYVALSVVTTALGTTLAVWATRPAARTGPTV